jgi:hypothetical protein
MQLNQSSTSALEKLPRDRAYSLMASNMVSEMADDLDQSETQPKLSKGASQLIEEEAEAEADIRLSFDDDNKSN